MIGTLRLNEVFDAAGEPRDFYRPLLDVLSWMGPEGFAGRRGRAKALLKDLGATFPLPDGSGEKERVLPADWVPRIVPRGDWEGLSDGLLQRGRAINAWLRDLYAGEQTLVPGEVLQSSVFYEPGLLPETAAETPVHVYGPDVVHLREGEYVVLEDNVRVPSGVAYSEAVRRAGLEAFGETFEPYRVGEIRGYYDMLRASLESAAPPGVVAPTVAVFTGGPRDATFFEHRRIAEACGFRLLTPDGYRVVGGEVVDRSDDKRVDVVYWRMDDACAVSDLPDLERVYREGGVGLANAPGVGIVDDKAVFPYVPGMIRHYLHEEPVLSDVPTISLADPERCSEALERLPEMVLKPREGYGGLGVVVGPEASREELEKARRDVRENPAGFIVQECLDFSTHVLDDGDGSKPTESFVDLRAFVLPGMNYAMPGGLTRVAKPGTRVVNSSSGGSFKDTWVLED